MCVIITDVWAHYTCVWEIHKCIHMYALYVGMWALHVCVHTFQIWVSITQACARHTCVCARNIYTYTCAWHMCMWTWHLYVRISNVCEHYISVSTLHVNIFARKVYMWRAQRTTAFTANCLALHSLSQYVYTLPRNDSSVLYTASNNLHNDLSIL